MDGNSLHSYERRHAQLKATMEMQLVSVNVGLPREVAWHGRVVRTSIWKDSVEGLVHVSSLNLEGDKQSDLSVHGGLEKAVYAYPREHYEVPGVENCRRRISRGARSVRTSRRKGCLSRRSESAIASASVPLSFS